MSVKYLCLCLAALLCGLLSPGLWSAGVWSPGRNRSTRPRSSPRPAAWAPWSWGCYTEIRKNEKETDEIINYYVHRQLGGKKSLYHSISSQSRIISWFGNPSAGDKNRLHLVKVVSEIINCDLSHFLQVDNFKGSSFLFFSPSSVRTVYSFVYSQELLWTESSLVVFNSFWSVDLLLPAWWNQFFWCEHGRGFS